MTGATVIESTFFDLPVSIAKKNIHGEKTSRTRLKDLLKLRDFCEVSESNVYRSKRFLQRIWASEFDSCEITLARTDIFDHLRR